MLFTHLWPSSRPFPSVPRSRRPFSCADSRVPASKSSSNNARSALFENSTTPSPELLHHDLRILESLIVSRACCAGIFTFKWCCEYTCVCSCHDTPADTDTTHSFVSLPAPLACIHRYSSQPRGRGCGRHRRPPHAPSGPLCAICRFSPSCDGISADIS